MHVAHQQNEAILRDFLPKCMLKSWLELELTRARAVEKRILYETSFQNARRRANRKPTRARAVEKSTPYETSLQNARRRADRNYSQPKLEPTRAREANQSQSWLELKAD